MIKVIIQGLDYPKVKVWYKEDLKIAWLERHLIDRRVETDRLLKN